MGTSLYPFWVTNEHNGRKDRKGGNSRDTSELTEIVWISGMGALSLAYCDWWDGGGARAAMSSGECNDEGRSGHANG